MAMARKHPRGTPKHFSEAPDSKEEYTDLYKKTMLSADEAQQDDTIKKIQGRWAEFLRDDLTAMDSSLKKAELI